MSTGRRIALILLVGSVWGMLEVLLWDAWHLAGWSHASPVLAVAALFCLAAGRRVVDVPGSSLAMAAVACVYKFASVAFFACQMTGVLTLAAAFELAALLAPRLAGRESPVRPYLLGLLTVYPAFFAFAILTTFVFQTPHWAGTGWTRILPYMGWGATLGTIGGVLSGALGWTAGTKLERWAPVRWPVTVPVAAVLWAVAVVHALGR